MTNEQGFITFPIWVVAIAKGAKDLLGAIPRQVWIALAIAAALAIGAWRFNAWLDRREQLARADERKTVNAEWQERKRLADASFAAEVNRRRSEVADWVLWGIANRDALALELRGAEVALVDAFYELRTRRPIYVTQNAVAGCTLTRGVVMQFNAGADRANGVAASHPSAAPEPAPGVVDAPAGVPLDRYAGAVEDTQSALGTCRVQVDGWQQHWKNVTAWYLGLTRIAESCFPKGASQ